MFTTGLHKSVFSA